MDLFEIIYKLGFRENYNTDNKTELLGQITNLLDNSDFDVNYVTDTAHEFPFYDVSPGMTALHVAVDFEVQSPAQQDVVKILIKHGANLEILDSNGHTPLHKAVVEEAGHRQQESMVKLLIKNGANINTTEPITGYTPLHSVLHILGGMGFGDDRSFFDEYEYNFNMVNLLINLGADLSIGDAKNNTPLHKLVEASITINDYVSMVFGNDPVADHDIHLYVEKSAKLLIKKGAKVNAVNNDNNTPLHIAFKASMTDRDEPPFLEVPNAPLTDADLELASILLKAGANLKLRNNDGQTPYELADVPRDQRFNNPRVSSDLTRFIKFLKNKKYAEKLKLGLDDVRKKARDNVTKKVEKTLNIPSDVARVIAEYRIGAGKRTRRRDQKNSKKKRRKKTRRPPKKNCKKSKCR